MAVLPAVHLFPEFPLFGAVPYYAEIVLIYITYGYPMRLKTGIHIAICQDTGKSPAYIARHAIQESPVVFRLPAVFTGNPPYEMVKIRNNKSAVSLIKFFFCFYCPASLQQLIPI